MKEENKIFYTYALISSLDNKIFYIGKGKKRRMYRHYNNYIKQNKLSKEELNKKKINKKLFYKIKKIYKNNGQIIYRKFKENISESKAFDLEKRLIKIIGIENLCNLTHGGEGGLLCEEAIERMSRTKKEYYKTNVPYWKGKKRSEEDKKKFSLGQRRRFKNNCSNRKGVKLSQETKDKISKNSKSGTPEVRRKISISNKGKKVTLLTRIKQSAALLGHETTSATREKISNSNKGKKRTKEQNDNNSRIRKKYFETHDGFNKGRKFGDEAKRNMSLSHIGHKQSKETCDKRSRIMKKIWRKRKNGK